MTVKFIDLFAGIGGFHQAFHNLGAECVFASEWDKFARLTYEANYRSISPELFDKGLFAGDITKVSPASIPDFDVLCAGFPCQPFSNIGKGLGFTEARGTLFFNILEILATKQPAAFFLENVRGILNHDNGETMRVIEKSLHELGYSFHYKLVKASDYGLPTHRPRVFMVGFLDPRVEFSFPEPTPLRITLEDIFGGSCDRKVGYTLRVGGRGSPYGDRRNYEYYLVDGTVRRITVDEGKKMMGFPDNFAFPVPEIQAMKQLGNSVAVDAVQATARNIIDALESKNG